MSVPDLVPRLLAALPANRQLADTCSALFGARPDLQATWDAYRAAPLDAATAEAFARVLRVIVSRDPALGAQLEQALSYCALPATPAFVPPVEAPAGGAWLSSGASQVGSRRRLWFGGLAAAICMGAVALLLSLTGSSAAHPKVLSQRFTIAATDSTSAVKAFMTLTLGPALARPACGTLGNATVFPVTMTLRNDDDTSWGSNSRYTHPALELFTMNDAGETSDPQFGDDPVIVTDRNCRPFSAVAYDYMEIPAHQQATLRLEIQAATRDPHSTRLVAILRSDSGTPASDNTGRIWTVRMDGTTASDDPQSTTTTTPSAPSQPSLTGAAPASSGASVATPDSGDSPSRVGLPPAPLSDSGSLCSLISKHVNGQGWYSEPSKSATECSWSNPQDFETINVLLQPGGDLQQPLTQMYGPSAPIHDITADTPVRSACPTGNPTCMATGHAGPGTVMVYFDTFGSANVTETAVRKDATTILDVLAGYCTPQCPSPRP